MNNCPCCSSPLLLHIRSSGSYWFCRHCWQEMPVLTMEKSNSLPELFLDKLSKRLHKKEIVNVNISLS